MKYHNISKEDMLNGDGFRVVLWVAGCTHNCKNCQNPITHDPNYGLDFDENALNEIFIELDKNYISGITLSGGDPLHENNLKDISNLIDIIRKKYPNKTIWIYSGYTYEFLKKETTEENKLRKEIVEKCDVFVDGPYIEELRDVSLHWRGSSNQFVWDMKKKEIIPDKKEEDYYKSNIEDNANNNISCCDK